jgi:hypothetical protein
LKRQQRTTGGAKDASEMAMALSSKENDIPACAASRWRYRRASHVDFKSNFNDGSNDIDMNESVDERR